jgi:methionine synthase II (cobalamin-independent)
MIIQFSENLPLLEINHENRSLIIRRDNTESELVSFYEKFMAEDTSYFSISRDYATGLYDMIELVKKSPEKFGPYLKGQSVGPLTFAASVKDSQGKSALADLNVMDALTKGLAIKALWQANKLKETGKTPIIFFDEPYLTGFGSAFSPIERNDVIRVLKDVFGYLRERVEILIGIHCCGNTDWAMLLESEPDIINFDAFSFMDTFLLYPEALSRFLEREGIVAWGIVPTSEYTETITVDELTSRLLKGLEHLKKIGVSAETLSRQSMITPSCGMGTMVPSSAQGALELLAKVSSSFHYA